MFGEFCGSVAIAVQRDASAKNSRGLLSAKYEVKNAKCKTRWERRTEGVAILQFAFSILQSALVSSLTLGTVTGRRLRR